MKLWFSNQILIPQHVYQLSKQGLSHPNKSCLACLELNKPTLDPVNLPLLRNEKSHPMFLQFGDLHCALALFWLTFPVENFFAESQDIPARLKVLGTEKNAAVSLGGYKLASNGET